MISFGIDFGTTNSVVAKASSLDEVEILQLGEEPYRDPVHPSVLAFEVGEEYGRPVILTETGRSAIELVSRYPDDFRYLQSLKSHVASRGFDGTSLFGQRRSFPELLATFIRHSGITAAVQDAPGPKQIVVGRPVKFHGEHPDEDLAIERYREAFQRAGISDFDLVFEPVGGAYSFFRSLRRSASVLIADFGGGTSDFVVARFRASKAGIAADLLSHAGIGIAGDSFDYRIIQNALLEHFGVRTTYRSNGKSLPMPRSYYSAFSRWHEVTQLRQHRYLNPLKEIRHTANDPEKIDNLIYAITMNKGLAISRAVSAAKAELSDVETADISIDLGRSTLKRRISRSDFETWIADDIRKIEETMEQAVLASGLTSDTIDRVFLVGGTSFVPAIHDLFVNRFGPEKLLTGERFSSVAEGLALVGLNKAA